jgi:hypothetical protein
LGGIPSSSKYLLGIIGNVTNGRIYLGDRYFHIFSAKS